MSLASVHSEEENKFILGLATGGNNMWIALTDVDSEGVFSWADKSPVDYTNWKAGQPEPIKSRADKEDCTYFGSTTGTWYDYDCSRGWGVACRRDA